MKTFHKKTVLLFLIVTGVLLSSIAVAGPNMVTGGSHDFSAATGTGGVGGASGYKATTITEVCIFCHTPHNANPAAPLWNKAIKETASFYRLYTSSATLTSVTKASSLTANSPSLLCLSCHDGKTAANVLHNTSAGLDASGDGYPGSQYIEVSGGFVPYYITSQWDMWSQSFRNLSLGGAADGSNDQQGDNLTNDHPIGFDYSAAYDEENTPGPSGLHTLAEAKSAGARFFDYDGRVNRVECSSCHNPHANYGPSGDEALYPFLAMSNVGSALCLACHNK